MLVGSLFSGIGGIDLGLERAGMHVAWQCEIDPWCRDILARHWPRVPCYGDIRSVDAGAPRVDVLAGGFPCQPVSLAGKGLAQEDPRWLWPQYERLIRLLRPRFVIVENVPGLLNRGLRDVLGSLAALGFDAEWTVFGARDVGAPHKRDRVWIVAHAQGERRGSRSGLPGSQERGHAADGSPARHVADAGSSRPQGLGREHGLPPRPARPQPTDGGAWPAEPDVGRVAHGVPARVDRLRALGNAVVPACAEHIGRIVMEMAR